MVMHNVFIGIGSNIGDRLHHLQGAADRLAALEHTTIAAISAIYLTEPIGDSEQHRFYNGVMLLETALAPEKLRQHCKIIEQELGRPEKYARWSPRVIDLDILLYDDICLQTETLSIPHPELQQRKFVLIPLLDIANPQHPKTGQSIGQLLEACNDQSVLIKTKKSVEIKKRGSSV